MLVLSRKPGERILIDPDIAIVVTEIRGGQVRLGFECPRHIRVLREELQGLAVSKRANHVKEDLKSSYFPECA